MPVPDGRAPVAPLARREAEARRILERYGSPLEALARAMADDSLTPRERLDAAGRLAPYLFPALKAVEVSGPGGERLTVEVRRAGPAGHTPDGHTV